MSAGRRTLLTPRSAILGLVLTAVLLASAYPLQRYVTLKAEIAALEREERTLDARAAELKRERAVLGSDTTVEELARELGYVRPGEVAFVVPEASPPPKPVRVNEATREPARARSSTLSRWWEALVAAARAVR